MGFFLVFLVLSGIGLSNLPEELAALSLPIHHACVERLPESTFRSFYAAMVCGAALPESSFKAALSKTGLLHLVVVSGSHLIWIESLLATVLKSASHRFRYANLFIAFALLMFIAAACVQAPVVRAALSLALQATSRRYSLGWSRLQTSLLSGFATLALFPAWIQSFSLLLSWTAALALSSAPGSSSAWRRQLRIYACLFVVLLPFAPPHPASIVFNVLAGPLLAAVFFPLALAVFFLPPLAPLADPLLSVFVSALEASSALVGEWEIGIQPTKTFLWCYLWALNLVFIGVEIRRRRAA